MLFEGWLNRGISTSRRDDLFETGLWYTGEGIVYALEPEACASGFVASDGAWYDMMARPEFTS